MSSARNSLIDRVVTLYGELGEVAGDKVRYLSEHLTRDDKTFTVPQLMWLVERLEERLRRQQTFKDQVIMKLLKEPLPSGKQMVAAGSLYHSQRPFKRNRCARKEIQEE